MAEEARSYMARLGVRSLDELIGRSEFLTQHHIPDHPKANTLDLSALLKDVVLDLATHRGEDTASISRICSKPPPPQSDHCNSEPMTVVISARITKT